MKNDGVALSEKKCGHQTKNVWHVFERQKTYAGSAITTQFG